MAPTDSNFDDDDDTDEKMLEGVSDDRLEVSAEDMKKWQLQNSEDDEDANEDDEYPAPRSRVSMQRACTAPEIEALNEKAHKVLYEDDQKIM